MIGPKKLPDFETQLTKGSAVFEMMREMVRGLCDSNIIMMGGGNPARIDEVSKIWHKRLMEILGEKNGVAEMFEVYDSAIGKQEYLEAIATLLNNLYGWDVSSKNIAIVNGTQSAYFLILNTLAGCFCNNANNNRILFPMVPEYVGYADQLLDKNRAIAQKPIINYTAEHRFKYKINSSKIANLNTELLQAVCVSRPNNPCGNILTMEEMNFLSNFTKRNKAYFIIDGAYSKPFPNIAYTEYELIWDEHIIMTLSLSKLGLPGARTGIIIAPEKFISEFTVLNAIFSLATASPGQKLTLALLKTGGLTEISNKIIQPYYNKKRDFIINLLSCYFDNEIPYYLHNPDGSFFIWIWFRGLPITDLDLYRRLQKRGVIVVPGRYFFGAFNEDWRHKMECIRISFCLDNAILEQGIKIIAEEVLKIYEQQK